MKNLIILLIFALWPLIATSGEVAKVNVGNGKYISVPEPHGFVALADRSPGFRKFSEAAEAPNSVLLEIFLKQSDMESVVKGNSASRDRELKVESFRSVYGRDLTKEKFEQSIAHLRASPDSIIYPEKEMNDFLSKQAIHYAGDTPKVSQTKLLGKFLDRPYGVGLATCSMIGNSKEANKHCVAQVIMLVNERILVISVVSVIHKQSDIKWIIGVAKSWASNIIAAN